MIRWTRSRTTFANVTSLAALFVALGGSSYAALNLPKGSVGAKQLRKNAVTSPKVEPGSLLLSDFRRSQRARLQGPQGLQGQPGPQGPGGLTGPPGEPATKLFAYVDSGGTVAYESGVTRITHPSNGRYTLTFDRSLAGCAVLTTSGRGFPTDPGSVTQAGAEASPVVNAGDPTEVGVQTFDAASSAADRGFFIAALC